MKKKLLTFLMILTVIFMAVPAAAQAAGEISDGETADLLTQIKQQLSAAFEEMDQETAEEVFSFLKDKFREENYASEEGLQSILKEGKEKFGVEVNKEESLYQEYGADFVDHVDEVVTGAVKNAASSAVSSFFGNLKKSVSSFFSSLF